MKVKDCGDFEINVAAAPWSNDTHLGKFWAIPLKRPLGLDYLHNDGVVRVGTTGEGTSGWFDSIGDVYLAIKAYEEAAQ